MSAGRRWTIYGLMTVVFGGNIVCFVFDRQLWPYSQYPMFATVRQREDRALVESSLVLVGERIDGGEIWFETQGYLGAVLSPMTIGAAFGRRLARPGAPAVDERLRKTYELYERRRRTGDSRAPVLKQLRLYRFRWAMRPDLVNLRTPERTLVATYSADHASIP